MADQHQLLRADALRALGPFSYVAPGGCWVHVDSDGACHLAGPWTAPARNQMRRGLAVLDGAPALPRQVLAHWCGRSAPGVESQLLVISGDDGLEVVRAEATIGWDDVAGMSIPAAPRVLTRTHHDDDVMRLAEYYARMRCALGHMARATP